MPRILLTAFEPYDEWPDNSSWLTLIELTRWFDSGGRVTTRRYPVDLAETTHRLNEDLQCGYDYAIHLGQSPGSTAIKLETTALNMASNGVPLVDSGPTAYRTDLPLESWTKKLLEGGIPVSLSNHAGTYLCNAIYFLSQHLAATRALPTRSCFIHLPLAPHQSAKRESESGMLPSMSLPMMAGALALVLGQLLEAPVARVDTLT